MKILDNPSSDDSPAGWVFRWAETRLPYPIRSSIPVRSNKVNQVFRLKTNSDGYFLKIGPGLRREYDRLQWLEGRLRCPFPVAFTTRNGVDAFLTSAIQGDDLAALSASLPPGVVILRLAGALKTIHATDITDWPFGGNGPALVHGDACLPNFIFRGEELSGCLDVGDMEVGDVEVDLSAAVWSLQYNLGQGHGLSFLQQYGVPGATEIDVERLRLRYENWSARSQ